ncbi:hypothetical protein [Arthrobacter sp. Br18]|nr:hypothetical protein [Arthrobacter sp. Br18]
MGETLPGLASVFGVRKQDECGFPRAGWVDAGIPGVAAMAL